MLDIGIKETTTTSGASAITLAAATGFARVADAFAVGDPVAYTIINGSNYECGIGTVGASNTLSRDVIVKTLVDGTLTDGGSAISLSGSSDVLVTQHHATPMGDAGFVPTGVGQRWVPNAANSNSLSTVTMVANRGYFMPFTPSFVATPFASMGIVVASASAGTAYAALFESKLVSGNLLPGRLLHQTGALDTGTTGEKLTSALGIRLKAGHVYWFGVTSSAAASLRAVTIAGLNTMLGFDPASTAARSHIYAAQSGAFGSDASGLTFSAGNSNVPAVFLGV